MHHLIVWRIEIRILRLLEELPRPLDLGGILRNSSIGVQLETGSQRLRGLGVLFAFDLGCAQ
jgi:hypothetical protein